MESQQWHLQMSICLHHVQHICAREVADDDRLTHSIKQIYSQTLSFVPFFPFYSLRVSHGK